MHRHLVALALVILAGTAQADPSTPSWEFGNTEETVRQLVQDIEGELESARTAGELGW